MSFGRRWMVLAAALAVMPAAVVMAAQVPVAAEFVSDITLIPTDMQFGNISFSGTPGASDKVTLGTDGSISYSGVFASGGSGTVAAGDVAIGGTNGAAIDVSCSPVAILAPASGTGRISLDSIKVADLSTASGGGVTCTGTGTAVLTFTLNAGTDDHLKVGGTLDGATATAFTSGTYSTANAGGTSIQVDVVYH